MTKYNLFLSVLVYAIVKNLSGLNSTTATTSTATRVNLHCIMSSHS